MREERRRKPELYPAMVRAWAWVGADVLWSGAAVLILTGVVPVAMRAQQPAAAATSLVFDGVTVVDVEQGKLVPDQRVVIAGNRIQAVGNVGAVKMPKGAQVVDARRKYLIPGLWDMHVHPRALTNLLYPLFIANGVTGIRDGWSSVPLDTMRRWRREILAGTRVGPPRQLLSGVAIDSRRPCTRQTNGWTGHICVSSGDSADARELVNALKAAGADMLKMYILTPATYFIIAAEARRLGFPFGGHTQTAGATVTAVEASDSGVRIIDHIAHCEDLDPAHASVALCPSAAARLRQNGTWVVPAMSFNDGAGNRAGPLPKAISARATKLSREFWADARLSPGNWLRDSVHAGGTDTPGTGSPRDSLGVMYLMQRAGVPILAGTDVVLQYGYKQAAGFVLHSELAMYVAEGLTPLAALQSATLNPAKMLRGTDSLGTVAPGKLADLVLLDADPLMDITNTTTIRAVVANGRYFDRAALDRLLAGVQAKKATQEP